MNVIDFKTKTYIQPRVNPSSKDYWPIALDIGYSSVKMFSPNTVASFPSYARQVDYGLADKPIGGLEKTSLSYRDEEGHEYLVGEAAQDSIRMGDSDNSTAALYVRDRYFSPEFKVIARVGMALGLTRNAFGTPDGKAIYLQTGLPPEYMSTDKDDIITALTGSHKFQIKIGAGEWKQYEFEIVAENVNVMPQPMGSLISISTNNNGIPVTDSRKYMSSNMLIIDPGFGTLDTFEISKHYLRTSKTWNNLGMLRVFQEASKIIKERYGQVIPIPAMQKILGDGSFKTKFDRVTRSGGKIEIAPILEEANILVCKEAINTIDGFYNYLQDQDYLVITGGTGAAWYDMFVESYKDSGVEIIKGTVNDDIPAIFSNVRGYYMNAVNTLKKR